MQKVFAATALMLALLAAPAQAAPPTVTVTAPDELRGVRGTIAVTYTIAPFGEFAELYWDTSSSSASTFRDADYTSPQTSGSFQVNTDAIAQGYLSLHVRSAIDNEFANSPNRLIVVDRTAPSLALALNNAQALKGSVNIPIDVIEAPVDRPDVLLDHVDLQVDGTTVATFAPSALDSGLTLRTADFPDGNHDVRAVAVDEAGNTGTSDAKTVSFDNTAPSVTFGQGTPAENQEVPAGDVAFSYAVADAHLPVTAECRLDNGAFGTCSGGNSGHVVGGAAPGGHRFEIRVTDSLGNQAVVGRSFRIDAGPPRTTILSGPAEGATLNARSVSFSFAVDDPTATTACRLTGPGVTADFGACSGPGLSHSAGGLASGAWVFEVRSTDALGNVETAVRRAFTIADVLAPILSPVRNSWAPGRRFTRVALLLVREVPAGGRVEVRCSGRGCPFKKRAFKVSKRRATLTKAFRRARLRPGATIEIRITAPNRIGKVVRYRIQSGKVPRSSVLCLPPGAAKPTRCG